MSDAPEVEEAVRGLLAGAHTMFLSTCSQDAPWGSGAFFAENGLFTLELVLELHGRTLRNIRQQPRVALVVSNGNPFDAFLQGAAEAEVLDAPEESAAVVERLRAKAPEIEPLLGAPLAGVRLHVQSWRATDVMKGWLPGKELVAPTSEAVLA